MAYRFNPAPGWPQPPAGWSPVEGWQPDPEWPPAPEGWEFWIWEDDTGEAGHSPQGSEQEATATPVPTETVDPEALAPVQPTEMEVDPAPGATVVEETPIDSPPEPVPPAADVPVEHAPAEPVAEPVQAPEQPAERVQPEPEAVHTWEEVQEYPEQTEQLPAAGHDPAPVQHAGAQLPEQQVPQEYAQQQYAPEQPAPQHYAAQQPAPQHYAAQQSPQHHVAPPTPPKKKGKGLLIVLVVVALVLAIAFVWTLLGYLKGDTGANGPEAPQQVEAVETPTPEPTVSEEPVAEVETVVEEEPEVIEEEPADLETLAMEAGLGDLIDFYSEFQIEPEDLSSDAVRLGSTDAADLTTIMVGPGGMPIVQEVGTLALDAAVTKWAPDELSGPPCPAPADGNEYVKLTLNVSTAPALQDYPFTGLELRFFDADGQHTGVVDMLLTAVCLGDFEAINPDWKRSGAHTGGVLAEVGPGTTTAAYAAMWGYGIDDTTFRWELADF